jgi:AcrR family transcriptional regulator
MAKYKKDTDAKEKILEAARNVFMHKGMFGARMQDIADEAGINKALLHYYFKNKEKLFEEIFLEAASKLFSKVNDIVSSDLPFFEKIEKFCDSYITVVLENPYLPLFVLNEINQDPEYFRKKLWGKDKSPKAKKFMEQIAEEVKKGTIREVSPLHLFLNLISMTIFPFVSKPMLQMNVGLDEQQFRMAMEQRKKEIPQFIINSIKK